MDREQEGPLLQIVRTTLGERAAGYEGDADLAAAVIQDLALDSLEKLQLMLDLERHLSVMANETDVAACRTVGDLIALILRSPATSHA